MQHFSRDALDRAFHRHLQASESAHATNDSYLLLRVYAAECGLKALLLRQRKLHTTARLAEDDLTHELDVLLTSVRARDHIGNCEADEPNGSQISPGQLHEIFRYGGRLTEVSRSRLIDRLAPVLRWIKENLT